MADPDPRWKAVAADLTWATPPHGLYEPEGPYGRWFPGGTLNAAVNCVDRHLSDRPAIHWEGEPGDRRTLTFRELADEVAAFAAVLRGLDVGPGHRVALHLGWLPEAVVAMLACARIGAPFSLIPVPLPVEALAERLESLRPRVLITQDGAWRHGTIIPTKSKVDDALTAAGGVQHTIVVRRTGLDVAWFEGDRWLHDLLAPARVPPSEPAPAPALPAEHPLLLSWLANRRGRPVLAVHGTATQLAAATALHRHGISSGGVFWCAGDIGWFGAQVHGVLGPLACGDTAVMFEGTVDVPNHRRLWDITERYGVATLLTTPSVLTQVRGWADGTPPESARRTLRRVVAMAEPLHPELWGWIAERVTGDKDAVADAWGQIELGAIVTVDSPADPERLPDAGLAVVDEAGEPVADGVPGEMVLRRPWAGTLRAVEGEVGYDHWDQRPGIYCTGDRAIRHPGNRLEFLGRIDPVVSVSGQLVSLAEIRDVLLEHPFLDAAEVVAVTDARMGRRIVACVVPAPGAGAGPVLAAELVTTVLETLGGLARPRGVLFLDRLGDDLPAEARRRALEIVAASAGDRTTEISWAQVLAASRLPA
ncbi:AMP-binding protein [Micromonospora sp. DT47]|uniref:AMP-binding protein n=1 Tax=Micromonospora sp. DT47 TaxID=3393431 RepID=UPI003CE86EFC